MNHQYHNSPLTEAVCKFQFIQEMDWNFAIAEAVYGELSREYPRRLEDDRYVSEGYDVEKTLQYWRNDDENAVVILSPNAVSVTHFQPYPGWGA